LSHQKILLYFLLRTIRMKLFGARESVGWA